MSTWSTAVLVPVFLAALIFVAGMVLGRFTRRRDARPVVDPDPAVDLATPTAPPPHNDDPHTVSDRHQSLRRELQRLLAEMKRSELDGSPGDMADLSRIWAARAAISRAEQELNQAIEQARRNGRAWSTIKAVLELPHPTPLNTEHR